MEFILNGEKTDFSGDEKLPLLSFLRGQGVTSVKNGCSNQGACGACLVEMNGKPTLACRTPMSKVEGSTIITIEGFPQKLRETLGRAFVQKGAVQCGFCTPGFLARTRILLEKNPNPSREDIVKALTPHICRCTGYVKIVEAVEEAARSLRENSNIQLPENGRIGFSLPKYDAYMKAIGQSEFIADMRMDNMVFGALKFSDHPRARILRIDTTEAEKMPGVIRVSPHGTSPVSELQGTLRTTGR